MVLESVLVSSFYKWLTSLPSTTCFKEIVFSPLYILASFVKDKVSISSVQFSLSFSHVRLFVTPWITARQALCPSPTPGVHSNSCRLSWWCHPTISSVLSPSPPAFNLSQHQGLFKWVSSPHQVAKVLEFLVMSFKEICIWLRVVLVGACGVLRCGTRTF